MRGFLAVCCAILTVTLTASAIAQHATVLLGTPDDDVLTGTPGPDAIYGLAGNDLINGAAGDDELDGGPGADIIGGGPGQDSVSYAGPEPVAVSLDGVADDGVAGQGANVGADVEDIYGGGGNDTLAGNAGVNTIDGGAGDDAITPGAGRDSSFGDAGDDTIFSRDGEADVVDCGPGNDIAHVDRFDFVSGCEQRVTAVGRPVSRFAARLQTRAGSGDRGVLVAITRLPGVAAGSTVNVRCLSGCVLSRTFAITARRRGLTLMRPIGLTARSKLRITVSRTGRVARSADFRFRRARIGFAARQVAGRCASDPQGRRPIACP